MDMNKPLIIICGSTATGKTDYALKIAKEQNGELVCADSRQIYKYLNIGTGKDIPKGSIFIDQTDLFELENPHYSIGFYEVNRVPLWLYDIVEPDKQFSAAEYARVAREVIKDIWSRRKTPIVVGGTGFYIKTLVDGIDTEGAGPNEELREQIKDYSVEQLQNTLKTLSPQKLSTMNPSDRQNPRRLIRQIELAQLQPQTISHKEHQQITDDITFIGLTLPKEELYKRIDERVEKRVQQGIVDEIKTVLKMGYDWSSPGLNALGYKEWKPYFEKTATQEEVVERWKLDEHQYAKRQLTWFKKDKRINWVVLSGKEPHR